MIMSGLGRGNPRPEEVRAPARRCYSCGFGVDQQTVHVEKNGFDGFLQHVFVLSSVPETANHKHGREKNSCASTIFMSTTRARRISATSRSNGSTRAGAARPRTPSRRPAS